MTDRDLFIAVLIWMTRPNARRTWRKRVATT